MSDYKYNKLEKENQDKNNLQNSEFNYEFTKYDPKIKTTQI